ncbi:uncharacterized protein J3D65DRAFT_467384 [Phyllosticta citribraziliensis]|uniref:Uncharacterized protein n=1 Tax=Phyllosticta citribraziliensis TaxID=989973 RepID=A0ABR1LJE2_9PEZI
MMFPLHRHVMAGGRRRRRQRRRRGGPCVWPASPLQRKPTNQQTNWTQHNIQLRAASTATDQLVAFVGWLCMAWLSDTTTASITPHVRSSSISATMHQDPLHVCHKGSSARLSIRSRRLAAISPPSSHQSLHFHSTKHHSLPSLPLNQASPRNHQAPASCLYRALASALPAQREKPRRLVALAD